MMYEDLVLGEGDPSDVQELLSQLPAPCMAVLEVCQNYLLLRTMCCVFSASMCTLNGIHYTICFEDVISLYSFRVFCFAKFPCQWYPRLPGLLVWKILFDTWVVISVFRLMRDFYEKKKIICLGSCLFM